MATGGGAPCFHDNMAFMNNLGTTVWLDTPLDIIATRVASDLPSRPLMQAAIREKMKYTSNTTTEILVFEYLTALYTTRAPFYAQARFRQ
jgi:shikimate kinase